MAKPGARRSAQSGNWWGVAPPTRRPENQRALARGDASPTQNPDNQKGKERRREKHRKLSGPQDAASLRVVGTRRKDASVWTWPGQDAAPPGGQYRRLMVALSSRSPRALLALSSRQYAKNAPTIKTTARAFADRARKITKTVTTPLLAIRPHSPA